MDAANLDKMVEKNRDLLECVGGEMLEMCWKEEERNGEIERDGSAGGIVIGLENLWYRFLLRTGTKDTLVPVRDTNRYQR